MVIKINEIPPEGLTVEVDEALDLAEGVTSIGPVRALVKLEPVRDGILHVTGNASATAELECSRCLKKFPFSVNDATLDFDLFPEGALITGTEHELGRSELDTEFYEGDEIDPRDFIREQILLALPMVPVHDPECKGLCPQCGADRNAVDCGHRPEEINRDANPFAVLKTIIKPEKKE